MTNNVSSISVPLVYSASTYIRDTFMLKLITVKRDSHCPHACC